MKTSILIIGAGRLGQGLSLITNRINASVNLWDTDTTRRSAVEDISTLTKQADILFLTIPASAVTTALETLKIHLKKKTPIICLAKGLDPTSGQTMAEILQKNLHTHQPYGLLYGPMLASELGKAPTQAVLATKHSELAHIIEHIFAPNVIVKVSPHLNAIALLGVLKNVYALGLGIASGLELPHNALGLLFAKALEEMEHITKLTEQTSPNAMGLAGIADLFTTATSTESANKSAGLALAQGKKPERHCEGIPAVHLLAKHYQHHYNQLPFLWSIYEIVNGGNAKKIVTQLLTK